MSRFWLSNTPNLSPVKTEDSTRSNSPSLVSIGKDSDLVLKIQNLSKIFDSPAGKIVALKKNNF